MLFGNGGAWSHLIPDRKMNTVPSGAGRSPDASGRWPQGDLISKGTELADEIARSSVLVEFPLVEVRTEIDEAGVGVCEEMPDDDEDRARHRDECPGLTSAADESTVALAEEGVRLGCSVGGFTEDALQVGMPVGPVRLRGPDWIMRGESFAQETRCPGSGIAPY